VLSLDDLFVCMAPLTRHWPEPTEAQWQDYHALLNHLPREVVMAAALKVLSSHVYPTFPKPAVILEAAGGLLAPVGMSGLESWGRVLKAAVRYGHDNPPGSRDWTFADPLTLDAVNAIGWQLICQSEDEMVMRAHYIKCYEQMRDRAAAAARELPAVAQAREQIAGRRAAEVSQLTAGIGRKS
jgi:hypothetical protein